MLLDWFNTNGIALPFPCRHRPDAKATSLSGALALILFITSTSAAALDLCRDDPRFSQFDFWIGNWQVYANDQPVGRNTITKDANGCVVREHWVNNGGTDGYSLRYFDPLTERWQMLWVSDGYSVHTDGGEVQPGEMLLSGEIHYFGTNLTTGFRVRFTRNPDGTVRQYAEQLDAETNTWEPWFDGIYRQMTDKGDGS